MNLEMQLKSFNKQNFDKQKERVGETIDLAKCSIDFIIQKGLQEEFILFIASGMLTSKPVEYKDVVEEAPTVHVIEGTITTTT